MGDASMDGETREPVREDEGGEGERLHEQRPQPRRPRVDDEHPPVLHEEERGQRREARGGQVDVVEHVDDRRPCEQADAHAEREAATRHHPSPHEDQAGTEERGRARREARAPGREQVLEQPEPLPPPRAEGREHREHTGAEDDRAEGAGHAAFVQEQPLSQVPAGLCRGHAPAPAPSSRTACSAPTTWLASASFMSECTGRHTWRRHTSSATGNGPRSYVANTG